MVCIFPACITEGKFLQTLLFHMLLISRITMADSPVVVSERLLGVSQLSPEDAYHRPSYHPRGPQADLSWLMLEFAAYSLDKQEVFAKPFIEGLSSCSYANTFTLKDSEQVQDCSFIQARSLWGE